MTVRDGKLKMENERSCSKTHWGDLHRACREFFIVFTSSEALVASHGSVARGN